MPESARLRSLLRARIRRTFRALLRLQEGFYEARRGGLRARALCLRKEYDKPARARFWHRRWGV